MINSRQLWKGAASLALTLLAVLAAGRGTASAQDAASVFKTKCAACHGAAGKGDGPAAKMLKPPPSDFAVSLKGKGDDWIGKAISAGGKSVGESPLMPAYSTLSADEVKALVAYVKQFGGP